MPTQLPCVTPNVTISLELKFNQIPYRLSYSPAPMLSYPTLPLSSPAPTVAQMCDSGRDKPKLLDVVFNETILSSLEKNSGKVTVMASEEDDDAPVWITDNAPFVVVTDPHDGSHKIDTSIPTETIFKIYQCLIELDNLPIEVKALLNSLQSRKGRKGRT
ncbi:unnamed protein product [Lactuca saligna]|uniref:Fructose-1-6-bisphosphatase class I N-terminal domain-containing protein n=1 Tax=Lactuca saligna TaxID=75948 RepID=A0AA36EFS3_LACSI|nr:unnamed protein product [Lactuca saligna]